VFVGLMDGTVAAFDDTTLDELWKINVGSGFSAPPMTFEVNGKQYVAIASGIDPRAASAGARMRRNSTINVTPPFCTYLDCDLTRRGLRRSVDDGSLSLPRVLRGGGGQEALASPPGD
jgi:hypothetical protein